MILDDDEMNREKIQIEAKALAGKSFWRNFNLSLGLIKLICMEFVSHIFTFEVTYDEKLDLAFVLQDCLKLS